MTGTEFTQHFYSLIASAVAGRSIPVHWHNNENHKAYSVNSCIYVPAAETSPMHAFDIIAQALLIRAGALRREHVKRLVGKRNISNRYLYAEIVRATRRHASILPRAFCENVAIRQFPFTTGSTGQSYSLAGSKEHFPAFPEFLGTLRCHLILKNSHREETSTPELKLQKKVTAVLTEDEQGDSEESIILKLLSKKQIFAAKGSLADFIAKLLGITGGGKPQKKPSSGGGVELPMGKVSMFKKKGKFVGRLSDLSVEAVATTDSNKADRISNFYPEWDYSKRKYRADWVLVDEVDPWREQAESEAILNKMLQPPSAALKRKLAGIGLSFETHRNQAEGEDYILDRVVNYFVDYRSGSTPNERVYRHNMKTRRDLAVMLLLDISGSTAEKESGDLSIHHKQMQLAYHLMTALHELGDHVSLYAFHSWGRTMVHLVRLKSFKERCIDSRIRNRLALLEPVGYTRIGGAMRHAARKLRDRTRLPYRILIVITDGFSYDHGYEGKYGEEDTKKAIEEIRGDGTGCLCLTIGSNQEEEKLRNIFGKASTLAARDYDDFIHNIRPALLRAVAQTRAG